MESSVHVSLPSTRWCTKRAASQSRLSSLGSEDFEVRSFVVDGVHSLRQALRELTSVGFPREYAVIAAMKDPEMSSHIMPTGDHVLNEGSVVIVSQMLIFTESMRYSLRDALARYRS